MVTISREWRIAYACFALRLFNTIGPGLASTALLRLFEATVCRQYYRQVDPKIIDYNDFVPEMKCKVAGVQSDVSNLSSIETMVSLVPMLVGALPYLILSRTVNKSMLLLIYSIGFLAGMISYMSIMYFYNTLDIRLVWLVTLFSLIGGGHIVFRSLVASIAAEALPKESLTAYYLYSSAILLVADVLSSAAGLQLMQQSPWYAVVLGMGFHTLSIPVLSFLDDGEPFISVPPHDLKLTSSPTIIEKPSAERSWTSTLSLRSETHKLFKTARTHSFSILIFFLHRCGSSINALLKPWMSKRYNRTLREIGFIDLGKFLWVTLVLLLIPHLHKYLIRRSSTGSEAKTASLRLVRWSIICSGIGLAVLSLSWTLVPAVVALMVYAAGSGFYDIFLGMVSAEVEKADLAQLFMCISIVEDLGGRVAGTVVFAIYGVAVKLESFVGMSLTLWVAVAFFVVTWSLVRRL